MCYVLMPSTATALSLTADLYNLPLDQMNISRAIRFEFFFDDIDFKEKPWARQNWKKKKY